MHAGGNLTLQGALVGVNPVDVERHRAAGRLYESRRDQKARGVGSFGPRGDSLGAAVLRVDAGVVDERPD